MALYFYCITPNPTLQFSWSEGDDAFTCANKIAPLEDKEYLINNNYTYGEPLISKHPVDGIYNGNTIRCIVYKRWFGGAFSLSGRCVKLELFSNNGKIIAIVSGSLFTDGTFDKYRKNDDYGLVKWCPLEHSVTCYTYIPKQKVIIPNISFGASIIPNVLYRDENGFVKIS